MPTYREVTVEVTDTNGVPFKEYGFSKRDRQKRSYCYIQSETDKQFHIRIASDHTLAEICGDEDDPDAPPLDLLATLSLDGRSKWEKRVIVYMTGETEIELRGSTLRDGRGQWKKCGWLFKDVGIDVTFENLKLGSDDEKAGAEEDEDYLSSLIGAMSAKQDDFEEKSGAGQIELRLDRISVKKEEAISESDSDDEKDMEQLQGSEVGDRQHIVGRSAGERHTRGGTAVYYSNHDPADQPFAIFRFYYCNEKKLRNLGFLEPLPTTPSSNKRNKALNLVAASQKKTPFRGMNAYKFRNLDAPEPDDGEEGDDEASASDQPDEDDGEAAEEEEGVSENQPLPGLGEELGKLGLDRIRKRDEDDGEEVGKKPRAE